MDTEIKDVLSFLKSIDFKNELWLIGVGIFHITISILALVISVNFQILLFLILREY